jgi:hypothetical protein
VDVLVDLAHSLIHDRAALEGRAQDGAIDLELHPTSPANLPEQHETDVVDDEQGPGGGTP